MEVNPQIDAFINSFWVFHTKPKQVTLLLKEAYNDVLYGLALPITRGMRRRPQYGYVTHPKRSDILIPVEKDMQAYFRANIMKESKEYFVQDIIDWINSCGPVHEMNIDKWKWHQRYCPVFREMALPLEQRIKLVTHGLEFTPIAEKAKAKGSPKEGALGQGEASPQGTEEETDSEVS